MATKKNTTRRRRSTTSPKIDLKKMPKQAEKPAYVVLGLLASKPVAMLIDKITGTTEQTVSGIFGIDANGMLKKWAKPLGVAATGLALSQLARNENMRIMGYGLAAGGGIIAVKQFWNKDLFAISGLEGFGESSEEIASPNMSDYVLPESFDDVQPSDVMEEGMMRIEQAVSGNRNMGLVLESEKPIDNDLDISGANDEEIYEQASGEYQEEGNQQIEEDFDEEVF